MSNLRNAVSAILVMLFPLLAGTQEQPSLQPAPPLKGMTMLVIFLKHDQSKTRTEFYPTYDYLPVWKASCQKAH
jgi:hypothetical protein